MRMNPSIAFAPVPVVTELPPKFIVLTKVSVSLAAVFVEGTPPREKRSRNAASISNGMVLVFLSDVIIASSLI